MGKHFLNIWPLWLVALVIGGLVAAETLAERIVLERGGDGRWRVVDPPAGPATEPATRPDAPGPATRPSWQPAIPPLPAPTITLKPGELTNDRLDDDGAVVALEGGVHFTGGLTVRGDGVTILPADPSNPPTLVENRTTVGWSVLLTWEGDRGRAHGLTFDRADLTVGGISRIGASARAIYMRGDDSIVTGCDATDRIREFWSATGKKLPQRSIVADNRITGHLGRVMGPGNVGYFIWAGEGTGPIWAWGNHAKVNGFAVRVHGLGGESFIRDSTFLIDNLGSKTFRGLAPRGVTGHLLIDNVTMREAGHGGAALNVGNSDYRESCHVTITNCDLQLRYASVAGDTRATIAGNRIRGGDNSSLLDLKRVDGVTPRLAFNGNAVTETRATSLAHPRADVSGLEASGNTPPFNRP